MSPLRKAPGKTQSGNLEEMRRNLQSMPGNDRSNRSGRSGHFHDDDDDVSLSPPGRGPSSLSKFLISPLRKPPGKSKSGDSLKLMAPDLGPDSDDDNRRSSHDRSRSHRQQRKIDRSLSPEPPKKPSSLKAFLVSPLRKPPTKTRSADLDFMAPDLDSDSEEDHARSSHSRSTRRSSPDKNPKKTKTFKQLLGKKVTPSRTKSSDFEASGSGGRGRKGRAQSPPRRPLPPERELSLSPEDVRKPKSLINNLLDNLYDSYVKGDEGDDEEEDMNNMHNSVSRLDMSLTRFF